MLVRSSGAAVNNWGAGAAHERGLAAAVYDQQVTGTGGELQGQGLGNAEHVRRGFGSGAVEPEDHVTGMEDVGFQHL